MGRLLTKTRYMPALARKFHHSASENLPEPDPELARLHAFGAAIDAIRRDARAKVGAEDLDYVRRLDRRSHILALIGRIALMFAPGPIGFVIGVFALAIHKQLQVSEIGHTALHGAFNQLPDAGRYHSSRYRWQVPIDEASWLRGHNGRHHGLTNVAGQDADIHFGPVRLTEHTPHRFVHYFQLPFTLFILFPNFTALMNLHFTGLSDVYSGNGRGGFDFITERSREQVRDAHRRALRKYLPYYGREYLLFPLLAGLIAWPLALRVLVGNWLSEVLRDIYSAATIYCGHVGEHTAAYPEGTMPRNKGERYAMQVEAANNFSVPHVLSVLCGALDLQIEHHLFPTLPANRLREVAPQVRAACAAHGVEYRCDSWPRTLGKAFKQIARLSRKLPHERSNLASAAG